MQKAVFLCLYLLTKPNICDRLYIIYKYFKNTLDLTGEKAFFRSTTGERYMILTVDIGNTNIVLGGFEGEELCFIARLSTNTSATSDEYSARIISLLELYDVDFRDISGTICASVVPQLNGVIKESLRFIFNCEPIFVGPGIKSGIGIRCDIPSSVGADIIAAAVAAHYLYTSPCLIVDIGTATKISLVNDQGAFAGTSIIPGVMMGLNALSECTAQLPRISLEVPRSVIGKNTADSMRSGVMFGNASLIDGMIDRIFDELGKEIKVLATGGLASTLIPLCRHEMTVDEHLVLRGLNILYSKNI